MGTADEHFYAALNEDSMMRLERPLPAGFRAQLEAAVDDEFKTKLKAVEGAHHFADNWQGIKAVASSSLSNHLNAKLVMTGLHLLFGAHVYSAEQVRYGKPQPDVFLYAADQISTAPSRCLVIEDSINGVLAAKVAGMLVAGFIGGGHCLPGHAQKLLDAGAYAVFERFSEFGGGE